MPLTYLSHGNGRGHTQKPHVGRTTSSPACIQRGWGARRWPRKRSKSSSDYHFRTIIKLKSRKSTHCEVGGVSISKDRQNYPPKIEKEKPEQIRDLWGHTK